MKTKHSQTAPHSKRNPASARVSSTEQPHLPDPTYDRSAVMKAAHREYKYAKMKGWTTGPDATSFASCLRLAHHAHAAYQRRAIFAAQGLRLVA